MPKRLGDDGNITNSAQDSGLGVVYTKPEVVSFVLDLAGYTRKAELAEIKILDVGCGYGQFIGEAVRRLARQCFELRLDINVTLGIIENMVRGIEYNPKTAEIARSRIIGEVEEVYGKSGSAEWASKVVQQADFLRWNPEPKYFDLIVGNFPYVRYDAIRKLPQVKSIASLRNEFTAFRGRADYSVAFLQRSLDLLSRSGRLSIITSNRFTQAEYGKEIRRQLAHTIGALDEIDLRNTKAFDEDVSAYASLFVSSKAKSSKYVVLKSISEDVLANMSFEGIPNLGRSRQWTSTSRGRLPMDGSPWSPLPHSVTQILMRLKNDLPTLADVGFKVSNGPATGANRVFVGTLDEFDFDKSTESKFLLPLYTAKTRFADLSKRKFLLSLYEPGTRRLLQLRELPGSLRSYLCTHRSTLKKRHIVRVAKKKWWATIDSFDPALLKEAKILVPDLAKGTRVILDKGKYMPSHSLLCVTGPERGLSALVGVLQSPVVDLLRLWMSPSMRNGTPRASSKVLSAVPVPRDFLTESHNLKSGSRNVYGLNREQLETLARANARLD